MLLAPAPERPRAPPEVTPQGRATLVLEHRSPTTWSWGSNATHAVSREEPQAQCSRHGPAYLLELRMVIPHACPSLHQDLPPQPPRPCPSSPCLHASGDSKLTTTQSSLSLWHFNGNAPPWTGLCPWAAGLHCRPGFGGRVLAPQRSLDSKSCPQACHFLACTCQSLLAFRFLSVSLGA